MLVIFKILQGIPLFKAIFASMENNFTQRTSTLTPEKSNETKK